jgi:hypothetical protein
MKTRITFLFFFLLTVMELQAQNFEAFLSGHQEVHPIATRATGSVSAMLDGNMLTVSGHFRGIQSGVDTTIVGGAHLHLGMAGQNGPVAFPLNINFDNAALTAGSFLAAENTFMLSNEQIMALMNRGIYVNIHSITFGGGELRGQILPAADTYYSASLLGSNEVPSIMTSASGALQLELTGNTLVVTGAFANLEGDFDASIAGGAHLHIGNVAANGAVSILLNATVDGDLRSGTFEAANNTFTITEEQRLALEQRQVYANLHTTAFPSGELRGQINGQAMAVFRAHLSGSNEIPFVTTQAEGRLMAELMQDSVLMVYGGYFNLEGPLAIDIVGGVHLHSAVAGSNGPVEVILNTTGEGTLQSGAFEAESNTAILTEMQTVALFDRGMYLNIHSEAHMGGELRGQLLPECQIVLTSNLSSIFTVPSVSATAMGTAKAEISGNRLTVTGSFDGLGSALDTDIAGGVHIHTGVAGATGGVQIILNTTLNNDELGGIWTAQDNTFEISAGAQDTLRTRGNYINIHSLNNASGEIRGQILGEATTYFVAPLSGASQTPSVNTMGSGMAILEVTGQTGVLSGSFANMRSAFNADIAGGAHIHYGMDGQAGGIATLLNATVEAGGNAGLFENRNNVLELSAGLIDTLRMRGNYLNIHTVANVAGELRGQFLPLATAYHTTTLSGMNQVQLIESQANGSFKLELNGEQLTLTGSFSELSGMFDANIAGGSHLHVAGPGNNGDIAIELNPTLEADLMSGIYTASDNQYMLDAMQMEQLRSGQWYVNIHTTTFGSGELRGQVLPEINLFPSDDAAITSPMDGMTVLLEGAATDDFTATWSTATDETEVAYIWQLSTDADFNNIIVNQNVGASTSFTTDFGTVDALLESLDVLVGIPTTVYHRVVTSDGSLSAASEASAVVLVRGLVTGVQDVLAEQFQMFLYPNLVKADNPVRITIDAETAQRATLNIFNQLGQPIQQQPIEIRQGRMVRELNVQNLTPGTYFVSLQLEGYLLAAQRLIIK